MTIFHVMQFFKIPQFHNFLVFAAGLLDQPQALASSTSRRSSDEDVIFVTTAGPPPPSQQPLAQPQMAFVPQPVQYVQQSYPANPMNFAQAFHQQTGRTLQYVTSIPLAAPPGSAIGVNPGFQYPVFHQPLNYVTPVTPQPFIINQQPQNPNLIYAASQQPQQPLQSPRPPPAFQFPASTSNPIFR